MYFSNCLVHTNVYNSDSLSPQPQYCCNVLSCMFSKSTDTLCWLVLGVMIYATVGSCTAGHQLHYPYYKLMYSNTLLRIYWNEKFCSCTAFKMCNIFGCLSVKGSLLSWICSYQIFLGNVFILFQQKDSWKNEKSPKSWLKPWITHNDNNN